MPRETLQTLTEPMYYVLLSLVEPRCGIEIMERARELSGERVIIGPGTLYTMLAKFEENRLIAHVEVPDAQERGVGGAKRKHYLITDAGKATLRQEYDRLARMAADGRKIMEGLT